MKKGYYILLLLLLGLSAPKGFAAPKLTIDDFHFVSVWGNIGYASLINKSDIVKPKFGFSPSLGVGYRYIKKGLIVQVGVEGQYDYWTHKNASSTLNLKMTDTEGDPFEMIATMHDYRDVIRNVNVNVPVLLGYEYKRFYFLAGASVGLSAWSSAVASSKVTTQAKYEAYIDPFEDMPNHFIQGGQSLESGSHKVRWKNPSVNLHAEIGGRVDYFLMEPGVDIFAHKYRLYVAAFFDYGLLNIHGENSDRNIFDCSQVYGEPLVYQLTPAMVSQQMNDVKVNPLVVGVKFTFLWQLPGRSICVICKH